MYRPEESEGMNHLLSLGVAAAGGEVWPCWFPSVDVSRGCSLRFEVKKLCSSQWPFSGRNPSKEGRPPMVAEV